MHRLPVQGTEWHTDNRGDLDAVESTATYMYYWYRMVPVKVLLFYGIGSYRYPYGKVSRILIYS